MTYEHLLLLFLMNRCPIKDIMSEFRYSRLSGTAEATLYSMFKFHNSNRVHFQCDILVCNGRCPLSDCSRQEDDEEETTNEIAEAAAAAGEADGGGGKRGRSLASPPLADALLQSPTDGAVMASYSVFVVEPGQEVGK